MKNIHKYIFVYVFSLLQNANKEGDFTQIRTNFLFSAFISANTFSIVNLIIPSWTNFYYFISLLIFGGFNFYYTAKNMDLYIKVKQKKYYKWLGLGYLILSFILFTVSVVIFK